MEQILKKIKNNYQSRYEKRWIALILVIATICFGGVLAFNPFGAVNTLVMFIGLFLIYNGISDIWIASGIFAITKVL